MTQESSTLKKRGKGHSLSVDDSRVLDRLLKDNSRLPVVAIRNLFREETGSDVSRQSIYDRRNPKPEKPSRISGPGVVKEDEAEFSLPDSMPIRMEQGKPGLSDENRDLVRRLIKEKPSLTNGQLANLFRNLSGISIDRNTVKTYRLKINDPPAKQRCLSDREREILLILIKESAPEFCRAEIARQFLALSGRYICDATVKRYVVNVLGLPKVDGRNFRRGMVYCERDIENASRDKMGSSKVNRSIRVGHASRAKEE